MRVFVTGASGFIGSAVVPELLGAGHEVVGLARSDTSATTIADLGGEVLRGDVTDLDVLRTGAAQADAVVHLAFRHDVAFTGDFPAANASDRAAIEAIGEILSGTDKALTIASGTALVAPGRVSTEQDDPAAVGHASDRGATATLTIGLAERGVRSSVVRLPPTVHDAGDNGFVPATIRIARDSGVSAYVGDGTQRWAAVHRLDAARLFRLAIEQAPAGAVLHAVGEEGVPLIEVATLIGRRLGVPVASIPREAAAERFGFLAGFLAGDVPSSSVHTQELLDWQPTGIGLLEDMDRHYFG